MHIGVIADTHSKMRPEALEVNEGGVAGEIIELLV
jgi:hypothetical protein